MQENKQIIFYSLILGILSLIIISNQNVINEFDSKLTYVINSHRIAGYDSLVNFLSNLASPLIIAIILLYFTQYIRTKSTFYLESAKIILLSFTLSALSTFVIKNLVCRVRPFNVNPFIEKLGSGGSYSFPSGHTADAFTLLFSIILIIPTNKPIRIAAIIWAFFIAYSRLYLGVHFITDLFTSVLLAKTCVLLSHKLLNKKIAEL